MSEEKYKSNNRGDKFEDNLEQINFLIGLHLSKWKLKGGIPSIGLDDIKQELLIQIHRQWEKYDNSRPLGNWLTTLIQNKLFNLRRDNYYKFASICLNCPSNLGGGVCKIYGNISSDQCSLYKQWEKERLQQFNVNMPVALENHSNQINSMIFEELNYEKEIENLKLKLEEELTYNEYVFFVALHLEKKTEQEVLSMLKFVNKTEGLRQLKEFKQTITAKVKEVLKNQYDE